MAKHKKKRRLTVRYALRLFICTLIMYLLTNLIVNTLITKYSMQIQEYQWEIDRIKIENEKLRDSIEDLKSKANIEIVAEDNGLSYIEANVVHIH